MPLKRPLSSQNGPCLLFHCFTFTFTFTSPSFFYLFFLSVVTLLLYTTFACTFLFLVKSVEIRTGQVPASFTFFSSFFSPFISNFDRLAMTDGHSAPSADAPAPAAAADCNAAPVPADVRSHAHHHQAAPTHDKEQVSSMGRITPRPTFLEHLATSRDSQFQLDRRDSSELDRYFVSQCYCEII